MEYVSIERKLPSLRMYPASEGFRETNYSIVAYSGIRRLAETQRNRELFHKNIRKT